MSMKNFALMFDTHMEWLSQQIIDENANTTELGRQLQAASEARIAFLEKRFQAISNSIDVLQAEKDALKSEITAEFHRAESTSAEVEARHAALNAIMEGPRDTEKAAA